MTDYYESITSKIRARALLGMPILGEVFDSWLAEVERAAAVKALRPIAKMVAPIIARIDPKQIGTHSTDCHQYHVGCLALAIQRSIHN